MEYFKRLGNFWFQDRYALFWLLLAIPIMISFQSTVHEGTHSFVAFLNTGNFAKIEPFLMNRNGDFHNGFTPSDPSTSEKVTERFVCGPNAPLLTRTRLAGWIGWPQIGALLLAIGISLIFLLVRVRNPVIGLLWRAWYLAACVDFIFNTFYVLVHKCKDSQDWAQVMIRGDHSFGLMQFVTFLLWLPVLAHFVWVWWSKWGTEPLPDRKFWGYRWLAFVLGLLALMSLLFYAIVRDDAIDYGSAPYVLGLLLQIAGFIFYWLFFGLSFKYGDD
jgi:hypothetical protein